MGRPAMARGGRIMADRIRSLEQQLEDVRAKYVEEMQWRTRMWRKQLLTPEEAEAVLADVWSIDEADPNYLPASEAWKRGVAKLQAMTKVEEPADAEE